MCESFSVDFVSIQTKCHEMNLTVPDKAGDVICLAMQRGLDALRQPVEARARIVELEASVAV